MRLFNTTYLIDLTNSDTGAVEKAKKVDGEESLAAVSVITVHEYLLGVHLRYSEPKELTEKLARAKRDLTPFQVIPLTVEMVEESSRLQAQMERKGQPMGINDLYIASTALELKLTLVTRDLADFRKVPGLKLETY